MNNQLILGEVLREFCAAREAELRLGLRIFAHPAWQLHCADVLALAVVRAALADENLVAVLDAVERAYSLDCVLQAALIACHKDREGGQRNRRRHNLADLGEGLTVRHNEARREGELRQRHRQLTFLHDNADALVIEYVAQHLLLRQNQAALRRSAVNRRHEDNRVAGLKQIVEKVALLFLRTQGRNSLLKLVYIALRLRADEEAVLRELERVDSGESLLHFT